MHQPHAPAAAGDGRTGGAAGDGPLVSVVTPCYNAAPFVAETIASVAAQTHPAVEHIVVDDCSSDGSWDVVRARGDRVRAVRLARNGGGSRARNAGAALARGAFLMFLDADDLIAPDTLTALVAAARGRPGTIGACPWRRLANVAGSWTEAPGEVPFPPLADALRGWLAEECWVPSCSVLWRRDTYERAGGWNERLTANQDGELMMRALARGARLAVTKRGMSYYRAHGAGRGSVSTSTFTRRWFESQLRVLASIAGELERAGRKAPYAELLAIRFAHVGRLAAVYGCDDHARAAFEQAVAHGGRGAISRTPWGRLLDQLVGASRKEEMAFALARRGIASRARRQFLDAHSPRTVATGVGQRRGGASP